jgi:alpha-D-ribose 1-methylphosphonate 5-phosphate C-P lyase
MKGKGDMMTRRGLLKSAAVIGSAALVSVRPKRMRYLYEVGPDKEFTSIIGALDQAWRDQGAKKWTSDLTVRIHPMPGDDMSRSWPMDFRVEE